MNMKDENNITLASEELNVAQQVLEGEGETWVILRWKEQMSAEPISEVLSVSAEEFNCYVDYKSIEKSYYRGQIDIVVNYNTSDLNSMDIAAKEVGEEEYFCRQLFYSGKGIETESFDREQLLQETGFSTLMEDGKPSERREKITKGDRVWEVQSPWGAWLWGTGEGQEATIKKVHVAQVGLYSILVEVVIKLEIRQDVSENEKQSIASAVEEETIYNIKDDSIEEVLGMPIARGFWSCAYKINDKKLILKNFKKIVMVYVSSIKGGERLRVASTVKEERMLIEEGFEMFCPVNIKVIKSNEEIILMSSRTLLHREVNYCMLKWELKKMQEKSASLEMVPLTPKMTEPVKRVKPCEKWLKKEGEKKKGKFYSIMTIKI
ncbi:MAG: hypothetical protein PHD60_03440 [Clostridia bacterium]|nr:hypothetical protein [Clostridia bacterium]